jgi:5-methylcytosine-specific restriction endonuclease McrA
VKPHTKIYMEFFDYGEQDFIPCEVCGVRANDVHHIHARGMGGNPNGSKDVIENLMAVCRPCHVKYGDKPEHREFLKYKHQEAIKKARES